MPQYYVINESTEDTLESTDSLQDATRVAKELASQAHPGDPVSILESGGKAIMQFILMPDGNVAEQAIARQLKHADVGTDKVVARKKRAVGGVNVATSKAVRSASNRRTNRSS